MNAETNRRLENIIKLGTIAEVDYEKAKARVKSGAILTDFLPFTTARAGDVKTWTPPSIGEQVLVFSMSGELTNGVIMTGIYQQSQSAPSQNGKEHLITFPDGTAIRYNHQDGDFNFAFPDGAQIHYNHKSGALEVKAIQKITITCPQITLNGNVQLNGNLNCEGNMELNGTIKSTGDQIAGSISQINHTHGGVMTGSGTTQPPK